ncbi:MULTISPECIES: SDR family NAD(P)-dependent oxidoreductase [unclassified Chelatococcus]|uniref:SDR family NAD(P)-dependent oxidoreductase n=1 Tax=unclassified Chelatococcus TaxID=2638111 RepID=UPI000319686F|nr:MULTISPECIES: 3-oxoacyl-ACP reductase family protein [unclassified Chelatococcus]ALA18686.1 oxidoreductase [Chelatococcus sp. CO-6]
MADLQDKVALVTGGSRGIGAAIARRLAAQGADVAITYAHAQDKAARVVADIEAAGGKARAIRADNRDPEAITAAVDAVVDAKGRIDILVNNAGIFEMGEIADLTAEDFDRMVDVNLRAVFLASSRAARAMGEGGRIVTTGSTLAVRVPWPGISLYAMSKAALVGLTKGMARDLGPRGITANIVHPGSTDTDMNPAGGESADQQRGLMAIARYGKPEDVADLVAWLAGPTAASVTGAEFTIDGGANA